MPARGRRRTLPVQSAECLLHIGRIADTLDGADSLEISAAKRKSFASGRLSSNLAHEKHLSACGQSRQQYSWRDASHCPSSRAAYFAFMNKAKAIRLLTKHAKAIRSFGVQHLYLFGSTARGDSNSASDVDIFVDLSRGAHFSLFDLIDMRRYLARILRVKADVFPKRGLHRSFAAISNVRPSECFDGSATHECPLPPSTLPLSQIDESI
jgi:predicted nucleotidyltransferase